MCLDSQWYTSNTGQAQSHILQFSVWTSLQVLRIIWLALEVRVTATSMYTIQQLSPHGYDYFIFNIVAPILASLAVGLRIWIRVFISKSFGVEDVLLLSSLVS